MARIDNLTNFLNDVATAIKNKLDTDTSIPASEFDTKIMEIETGGNYQSKSITITANGANELLPDTGFDAMSDVSITVNVPDSGGAKPNIFCQTTEPEIKKGIWLQTDKIVEHYIYDENPMIAGNWLPDGTVSDIPINFYYGEAAAVGNNIYLLYGSDCYKYDTLTDTYTKINGFPTYFSSGIRDTVAIGNDVYFCGGNMSYKYDTLTDTWTRLTDVPYSITDGCVTSVGTDIYYFGGNTSNAYNTYKYDTITDTYTKLTDTPYGVQRSSATSIGTNIYLFGSAYSTDAGKRVYKYDTLTDTYTRLTNIPYVFRNGSAVSVGSDIYLLGGQNSTVNNYKYDTLTDTWTKLTDIPYSFYAGSSVLVDHNIYLLGGNDYQTKVQVMSLESSTYEYDNLIVINQGKYSDVGFEIELYNNSKDINSAKYAFADAWFYTIQNGLITNIPTYYGNGTEWIKYKN